MKPHIERVIAEETARQARDESRRPDAGTAALKRILKHGVRDSDLDYLRGGMREMRPFRQAYDLARDAGISATEVATTGKYPGGEFPPIKIDIESSGKVFLHDGRHRYTAAREAGADAIRVDIRVYGPRGGLKVQKRAVIRLR